MATSKQTNIHTHILQCSPASLGLTRAHPNDVNIVLLMCIKLAQWYMSVLRLPNYPPGWDGHKRWERL